METSPKSIVQKLDEDLSPSWIELTEHVRSLAFDLKIKTASSHFSSEAEHLSSQIDILSAHVKTLHKDALNFIENLETKFPLHEPDLSAEPPSAPIDPHTINKEKIRIQRETHELRNDFKDILKALFLWVDDPVERLRRNKD